MTAHQTVGLRLSPQDTEALLDVTRALAAPFELQEMLAAVNAAARRILRAERSSVWLYDAGAHELILTISVDLAAVRLAVGVGLVGACAQTRDLVNVADCYLDPRFDPHLDRISGFRTRSSLSVPLLHHDGTLVGVLQLLNREGRPFDANDERLATALAAQCAVALARVRETQALLESTRLLRELELARVVQLASLPASSPEAPGYELHALFDPAEQTGGDTYDLARVGDEILVMIADATGHGIAPALTVVQMQAMLRTAMRCGQGLEEAFCLVNDQLAETLPDGHFVTAFVGMLNPITHRLRFVSGGQGPILVFRAGEARVEAFKATSFPMGAMKITSLRPPVLLDLAPGDALVLLSDGVFECEDALGAAFGRSRVDDAVLAHHAAGAAALTKQLRAALAGFARGGRPDDDVTMVVVRRLPDCHRSDL